MVDSQILISAALAVAALHILISFIFFLASMSNLGKGKVAENERYSFVLTSGIFWLISLLACIAILVLLTFVEPKQEKTPCPIQLSQPGDSNRGEIEDFIVSINSSLQKEDAKVPDFDSSLTYLIVTGFYKDRLIGNHEVTDTPDDLENSNSPDDLEITQKPLPDYKDLLDLFSKVLQKFALVPIGYIKDDVIYGLGGRPVFDIE